MIGVIIEIILVRNEYTKYYQMQVIRLADLLLCDYSYAL